LSFSLRYTAGAREDLRRLYAFLLERATTIEDLDIAERAIAAIEASIEGLGRSPFICRKAASSPFVTSSRTTITDHQAPTHESD
jgi:plasmid stabilization system protein ParE